MTQEPKRCCKKCKEEGRPCIFSHCPCHTQSLPEKKEATCRICKRKSLVVSLDEKCPFCEPTSDEGWIEKIRSDFDKEFGNTYEYDEAHTVWWLSKVKEKIAKAREEGYKKGNAHGLDGTIENHSSITERFEIPQSIIESIKYQTKQALKAQIIGVVEKEIREQMPKGTQKAIDAIFLLGKLLEAIRRI